MQAKFPAGSKVRLTAKFLRSTGQYAGGEPNSKWIAGLRLWLVGFKRSTPEVK